MLKVVLPAFALMFTSVDVRAEEIALDCEAKILAKLVLGERVFKFHVDVDDSGITYIPEEGKGDRAYYSNANGRYFRKTRSEIVWGLREHEWVINRNTGQYSAGDNGSPPGEVGTCDKAKVEQKF
jgi:hypothetical protein